MTQLFAMPHQVNSEIQRSEPMALLILTAQISELQLNHWHSRSTYTIMACSSNETTSSSLTTSYWSNLGTSSTKRKHGQVQFRSTDRTCSRESWQSSDRSAAPVLGNCEPPQLARRISSIIRWRKEWYDPDRDTGVNFHGARTGTRTENYWWQALGFVRPH
jgi:hypothetical protein